MIMFWSVKLNQPQFCTTSAAGGISDISVSNNIRDDRLQCFKKYFKNYNSAHFSNLVKYIRNVEWIIKCNT